jgi:sec-independent protein translocase protein TatC
MSQSTKKKPRKLPKKKSELSKTFLEHFQELKNRFAVVFISFAIGSLAGYFLNHPLTKVLLFYQPQPLFYTSPAGGLDFIIKISLFFGAIFSIPVLLYQVFKFIEPALPQKVKFSLLIIVFSSIILVLTGMAFAYFVSLPAALLFLNKFSTDQIKSLISTNEYLSFVFIYLLGFGTLFQLPLILLLINKISRLSVKKLFSYERYLVVISFLIAGILTPTPDLINQSIMAIPIIVLYQLSIVIIWLTNTKKLNSIKL